VAEQDPSGTQHSLAGQRAFLRFARLILNAATLGLIFTTLLAVVVLWLEKRSGIELDSEQYRGLLLIIFLTLTLSAYVVLEFFQHKRDQRDAKTNNRRRTPRRKDDTTFAPIFVEHMPPSPPVAAPAPPEQPQPTDAAAFTETVMPTAAAYVPPASPPASNDASASMFTQAVNAVVAGFDEEPTPFAQFGLHLYVAGACGEFVRRNAIPTTQGRAVFTQMLTDLGLSKKAAAAFAANANTFAQVPNFRGPIDAGYRAMTHLNDAGFVNIGDLIDALAQWKIQDDMCQAPEPVTFMATAIHVGVPGAVAALEDRLRVQRAHNTFMATAFERFQGREVHNLGNGIVAAFADAALAVRAAEFCLEQIDLFARENPTLTISPHIGIDTEMTALVAGQYVSVAITRAVTIASLTPTNNIYCSESTCDDAAAVLSFEPVDNTEGFSELPKVFSASWSRAPAKGGKAVEYRQIGTLADAS